MTVFLCGPEPDDIYCAVYDAWMSRLGHKNVCIEEKGEDLRLFCEYREVHTETWKAERMVSSIRTKLSEAVYEVTYKAALCNDRERADKIYRFLIAAFACGPRILDQISQPAVYNVFVLTRSIAREANRYLQFTRFSQMKDGILLGKIKPEHDVLTMIAPHFADRMPSEHWILYDCARRKAIVHQAGCGWVIVRMDSDQWQHRLQEETDEETFESLWRTFHKSIAIEARANLRCQQGMLPLKFRPYMTEFQQNT